MLTAPLRDVEGNVNVHYLLRLKRPDEFTIGKDTDGSYYFSVALRVEVFREDDKLIFSKERPLKRVLTPAQMEQVKGKVFGYEGWLPLPPGKYHLKFVLTNAVSSVGFQAEASVTVPEAPKVGLIVTPMIPFTSATAIDPHLSGLLPFSASGLMFSPLLGRELNFSPATDLQFFYQIWSSHDELAKSESQNLEAHYAFGRLGATSEAKTITDQVSARDLDSTGTLLTGKKIRVGDWPQGTYLLTLSLDSAGGQRKASASFSFRLLMSSPTDPNWDVFDGDAISKDVQSGTADYERGLCYLAWEQQDEATKWFHQALTKNPRNENARSALVNTEFGKNEMSALAELAREVPLTSDTSNETILRLADALDKTGAVQDAINLLQMAIRLKPPNDSIYLALASYYRRTGDSSKGDDFEKKGRALAHDSSRGKSGPVQN